jgi:hypothetical protein
MLSVGARLFEVEQMEVVYLHVQTFVFEIVTRMSSGQSRVLRPTLMNIKKSVLSFQTSVFDSRGYAINRYSDIGYGNGRTSSRVLG